MTEYAPQDLGLQLDCVDDCPNGRETTEEDVAEMLNRVRAVVGEYGYKIRGWAKWPNFRESCVAEQKFVDGIKH